MNNKVKQIYKNIHWDRVQQQEELLLNSINNSQKGFCFVRGGDGEIKALKNKDIFAKQLANAFIEADIIGLPDHFTNKEACHSRNWDKELKKQLQNNDTKLTNPIMSAYFFLYSPDTIAKIIKNKKVLWITGNATIIEENMKNLLFRSKYNFEPKENYFLDLHENESVYGPNKIEKSFEDGIKNYDFDIALVGAGIIGKIYCHYIKTELNKKAIDIGCIMSCYKEVRNRIVFRKELSFLVWQ